MARSQFHFSVLATPPLRGLKTTSSITTTTLLLPFPTFNINKRSFGTHAYTTQQTPSDTRAWPPLNPLRYTEINPTTVFRVAPRPPVPLRYSLTFSRHHPPQPARYGFCLFPRVDELSGLVPSRARLLRQYLIPDRLTVVYQVAESLRRPRLCTITNNRGRWGSLARKQPSRRGGRLVCS